LAKTSLPHEYFKQENKYDNQPETTLKLIISVFYFCCVSDVRASEKTAIKLFISVLFSVLFHM